MKYFSKVIKHSLEVYLSFCIVSVVLFYDAKSQQKINNLFW